MPKIEKFNDGKMFGFLCPGCDCYHILPVVVDGKRPRVAIQRRRRAAHVQPVHTVRSSRTAGYDSCLTAIMLSQARPWR